MSLKQTEKFIMVYSFYEKICFCLDAPSSPGEFEKELDAMFVDMKVKESNHSPLLNNAMKTQGRYQDGECVLALHVFVTNSPEYEQFAIFYYHLTNKKAFKFSFGCQED